MTIKLTNLQFSRFSQNILLKKKLIQTPLNHATSAYKVKKLLDFLDRKGKEVQKRYLSEILEKFAERDEKGEIIYGEGNQGFKIKEAEQDSYQKAQEEFDLEEFVLIGANGVPASKLQLQDLAPITFSAQEIATLEPLVDLSSLENETPLAEVLPLTGPKSPVSPKEGLVVAPE